MQLWRVLYAHIVGKYFLAVVETGSFSRAAEKLYVSQSSVSKHISQMEEELGFPLLIRTTRSVQLTPQGKMICEVLQDAVKSWENALDAARNVNSDMHGILRVGMLHGWCSERMPTHAFEHFQLRYPHVEVMMEKHTQSGMVKRLLSDSLDVIFTTVQEIQEYPELDYCRAFHVPMNLVISAAHPKAASAKSAEQLGEMNAYVMSREASVYSIHFFEDMMEKEGWKFRIIPCPNYETIMTAVEQQKGCAIIGNASTACASPKYRSYETGHVMRVVCAWNINSCSKMAESFLSLFDTCHLGEAV